MFVPAYKLAYGTKAVDTTREPRASALVELEIDLDIQTPADQCVAVFGRVGGLAPQRDEIVKIDLGYADNDGLVRVFTGAVAGIDRSLVSTRVVAFAAANGLLRTFLDRTFEATTAGGIVRQLAALAGVPIANIQEGITFPAYVIDGRRSAYRHIRALADLCGFDAYIAPDGKLVFEAFVAGHALHTFEFGKDILALDVFDRAPDSNATQAFGESPTGSAGADAWPWLTKDFSGSKGVAGSGKPLALLERSALRTSDASRIAAKAAQAARANRVRTGRLTTFGRPQIKLGDALAIRAVPETALNATFKVLAIRHRITKSGGFTTEINFRGPIGSGT
jgi:phage protein D